MACRLFSGFPATILAVVILGAVFMVMLFQEKALMSHDGSDIASFILSSYGSTGANTSRPVNEEVSQSFLLAVRSKLEAELAQRVRDEVTAALTTAESRASTDGRISAAVAAFLTKNVSSEVALLQAKLEQKVDSHLRAQVDAAVQKRLSALAASFSARDGQDMSPPPPTPTGARESPALTQTQGVQSIPAAVEASQQVESQSGQSNPTPSIEASAASNTVVSATANENTQYVKLPPKIQRPLTRNCTGTSLHGIPPDFCGVSSGNLCFDKWEQKYMKDHGAALAQGIETIRGPGCFPHGSKIAVMGYYRTGSTLLYNVARLWAALGSGDGLVAGYGCPDPKRSQIGKPGTPAESCTMVCKDHEWRKGTLDFMEVVLMSRRGPFYSVCSRKLMDVWCGLDQTGFKRKATWPEIDAWKAKCKSDPAIEKNETVNQCYMLMKMQADIYYGRRVSKQGINYIGYDVMVEKFQEDPHGEIRNIGLAMGICEEAIVDKELVNFIAGMAQELKKNPGADMAVTRMHDVHTQKQRDAKCSNLEGWMQSDPHCKAWMDSHASPDANAKLKEYLAKS